LEEIKFNLEQKIASVLSDSPGIKLNYLELTSRAPRKNLTNNSELKSIHDQHSPSLNQNHLDTNLSKNDANISKHSNFTNTIKFSGLKENSIENNSDIIKCTNDAILGQALEFKESTYPETQIHKYNNQFQFFQEQHELEKENHQIQMKRNIQDQQTASSHSQKFNGFLPNSLSSPNIFSSSSTSCPLTLEIKNKVLSNSNTIVGGPVNALSYLENKDFTSDLFRSFEKNTFLIENRDMTQKSHIRSIDNHVTEAR
jgi:hypothetical protein